MIEHLCELGVSWSTSPAEVITETLRNPQLAIPLATGNSALRAGMTLWHMSGELLNLELSTLEQQNQIEIIASLRLFTSHQQTAIIKSRALKFPMR